MHFWSCWFNKSKKRDEILQGADVSAEEFIHKLKLSGEIALKTVNCCRTQLGQTFKIPAEKLYPEDIFRDLIN